MKSEQRNKRSLRKSDWSEEMERRFQSVWVLYPQHSAGGEARFEFQRLNPDDALLGTIKSALEWQRPVFLERARKAKTLRVIPDFRRWLHNYWWEEDELDEYKRPEAKSGVSEGCRNCGFNTTLHWLKSNGGESFRGECKPEVYEAICKEYQG